MRNYAADWKLKQEEKNRKIKSRLTKERTVLIKDGLPTLKLQKVLYQIFSMYIDHDTESTVSDMDMDHTKVNEIMASRLWYRCGMKLSLLENILRSKERRYVAFHDFYSLITKVIDDEEKEKRSVHMGSTTSFEVGL